MTLDEAIRECEEWQVFAQQYQKVLQEIALPDDEARFADPRQLAARARIVLGLPTETVLYTQEG